VIGFVAVGPGYVAVGAAFHKPLGGALADPDTDTAFARVSFVDPDDGSFTEIAGSPFALVKRLSANGYWGVSLDAGDWDAGLYEVFVHGEMGGTPVGTVLTFSKSAELARLDLPVSELRQGNTKMVFTAAVADVPARNVAAGKLDSITYLTKADGASDWSSPTSSKTVLLRYATLGDDNPSSAGD